MRKASIYSEFLPGFGLKVRALIITGVGKESCALSFCMHRAHDKHPRRIRVEQFSCPKHFSMP